MKCTEIYLADDFTICPRSPIHVVTYYIKWVTTSWTYSKIIFKMNFCTFHIISRIQHTHLHDPVAAIMSMEAFRESEVLWWVLLRIHSLRKYRSSGAWRGEWSINRIHHTTLDSLQASMVTGFACVREKLFLCGFNVRTLYYLSFMIASYTKKNFIWVSKLKRKPRNSLIICFQSVMFIC